MSAIANHQIDAKKYARLVARTAPRAIGSEDENEHFLAIANEIMRKGEDNISPEEDTLLELLFTLIEKFEEEHYQIQKNSSATPASILHELMDARELQPKDLWEVFGSKGLTSDVLNGKQGISKKKAKALAEFFNVSVELFI